MFKFKVLYWICGIVLCTTPVVLKAGIGKSTCLADDWQWRGPSCPPECPPKGGCGNGGGTTAAVPEIDPAGIASLATLLVGGAALITASRRKA